MSQLSGTIPGTAYLQGQHKLTLWILHSPSTTESVESQWTGI